MTDALLCRYELIPASGPIVGGQFQLSGKPGENAREVHAILRSVFGEGVYAERVTVFWDSGYREMFVDEIGHLKGLPLNPRATAIYRNNVLVHEPGQHREDELPAIAGDAVLFDRRISLHMARQ